MTMRLELPVNPDGGKEPSGGSVGPAGPGVPVGGATGTGLLKTSNTNYATAWVDVATQDELDTAEQGLTLAVGTIANELADLVADLGDPDQIAWGAGFDAAFEATSIPAADAVTTLLGTVAIASDVFDRLAIAEQAITDTDQAVSTLALDLAQMHHIAFDIDAVTMTPLGSVGFDTVELQALAFNGAVRTSTGTVDDSIVFPLAGAMFSVGGLWTFTLTHFTGPDCGIYSIETTDDFGATWDVKGTVDGYAAVGAAARSVVTGVAVVPGDDQIRVRMGTKNASSSSFVGHISALSGLFVFT